MDTTEFNWDKTSRPELTLAQMDSIVKLVEACGDDIDPLCVEVKKKYLVTLLKEDAGVLTGTGIKKPRPPRKNSMAGLGFDSPYFRDQSVQPTQIGQPEQSSSQAPQTTRKLSAAQQLHNMMHAAPVYNLKQIAWMAKDSGTLALREDVEHLHTPDSKYEWVNDEHKGRIPPGKTHFNDDTQSYE